MTPPSARFTRPATVDHDLLARAIARSKAGDTGAVHFIYLAYADEVRVYVNGIVHDSFDAEDITHNVFTKLMTAIGSYEDRDVPFAAWLLRIARNAAFDHLRGRRFVPFEDVRVSEEARDEAGLERTGSLLAAFARLPTDQRRVLLMRHIAGLSPGEIAERLDKTEGSVHSLHHRGRETVQATLLELGAEPVTG